MARRPREFAAGVYHVSAHASADRRLFLDDADRRVFLELLNITWATYGLELISYVVMTSHYHVLTAIPDKRFSTALQILHGTYSREHNTRHRRSAHLFRAHCLARRVRDDNDFLGTAHYLASNPVKAGIAPCPLDWRWGSARAHAGLESSAVVLSERRLRGAFGEHPNWREHYADFISTQKRERPAEAGLSVAGAGFEPATSGL
jgi:putative transposase